MSPYERERRSNVFRGGGHVSPMEERQNRAKGLWTLGGFRRQRGGRTQSRRLTDAGGGARLWVNHGHRGACEPALNPRRRWEDPRKKGQGFKPDSGNPTVRLSGGLGKRGHGGNEIPSRNRKGGNGNPPPTSRRARVLSQPYKKGESDSILALSLAGDAVRFRSKRR